MPHSFLWVLPFVFFPSLTQIVPSFFPHYDALLRGLINHSGCLSVTPSAHTAVVPAAHMHFIHTIVLVSQLELAPSASVYKSFGVKNEATLRVTKDCFPSGRILPRFQRGTCHTVSYINGFSGSHFLLKWGSFCVCTCLKACIFLGWFLLFLLQYKSTYMWKLWPSRQTYSSL